MTPGLKRFSLDLPRVAKYRERDLEVGCMDVLNL